MTTAELLKAARTSRGLTARQLGSMLDCEGSSIYAWEAGRIQPTIETLRKYVASGLITPSEVFGRADVAS